jgi:transaldolase
MRPDNLNSLIFLDGGDPEETRQVIDLIGFLDGQTTNPSLIAKHPDAKGRFERGERFSEEELLNFYRDVVEELSTLLPDGSISIEVYADKDTRAEQMLEQAREMDGWIPNSHIKFPTSDEGLKAAEQAVKEGVRVNMTLCFSQEQAAAVYAATRGAKQGGVYVSPFIGRLDDIGQNGMDLIENVIRMYEKGDGHVKVLTASVRQLEHVMQAVKLESDIITCPFKLIRQWAESGFTVPGDEFSYTPEGLEPIHYKNLVLDQDWRNFDISHHKTDEGMEKFSADWNNLIK